MPGGSISSPSFDGIHLGPFDIRVYGLMCVVAVLAAVAMTTRRWVARGGSPEAAPGILVAQAIGRIGNYFNQELFGRPTSLPWGLRIDVGHRPDRYLDRAIFHPTFLYELLWNLLLAGVLVAIERRRTIRPPWFARTQRA